MKAIAWTIAGSDPSSGAGIQTDLLTLQDFNVHGCTVITALTAQDGQQVRAVSSTEPALLKSQIEALKENFFPQAIKLGMLGDRENIATLVIVLKDLQIPIVLDPVLQSSSGVTLTNEMAIDEIKKDVFPLVTLLTPNIPETEKLLDIVINNKKDITEAAKKFLSLGVKAVLIKGGHFQGEYASDYFTDGLASFWLHSPRVSQQFHGTGCLLSAAITAAVSLGYELKEAVVIGKMYLNQAMRKQVSLKNLNFLAHAGWPQEQIDLPYLTETPELKLLNPFIDCGESSLGFYPIVDSADWVERLCKNQVKTIQLRIKNKPLEILEAEMIRSIALSRQYQVRLFINDYWQLAIKHNAYGVHLGQEDLSLADINAIQQSGLRLGISTHSFYEVSRAHTYQPSYLAFGPIYETTSKKMPFTPRGLPALKYWKNTLSYPLVAIGGIDLNRLPDVLATGAENIAVISAITKAQDVAHATHHFLKLINKIM